MLIKDDPQPILEIYIMSVETRTMLKDAIFDVLGGIGAEISPLEIYGVLEEVKMDVRDRAMIEIKEAKKENRNIAWEKKQNEKIN